MTALARLRPVAVAALFLTSLLAPTVPSAVAATPAHVSHAPLSILDPPLPVEAFPGQVKEACAIWRGLHWPTAARPTDYPVPDTALVIRGSNVYGNRSGDLPADGHYREYDVNPRTPGQHRDAERLVRDPATHVVWYTDDHYANFREISSGCS
ncbi:guanine-specific ribonuclease N1 and T1 [Embleya scabrispora]|uniref:Guanine-specific ribonuclease N1 and T1 n=1 Tax=Embleya scabrispora TaxID=159449 RepID=A0A1T3NJW4_9ACTN|nr:ribonuclease domain-containing protein [Embleya scabrispora]OPC77133.1 guanine-specific ribonuclease N1 and T1 [Embleya scabrispora]